MADKRKKLRGVGDVRTALSTRVHAAPPQKGTTYRDLYLRGTEKMRLENEIARLEQQQGRVQKRLAETIEAIAKLQQEAESQVPDRGTGLTDAATGKTGRRAPVPEREGQWNTMPLEY